jgi:hypothetical protein
LKWIIRAFAAGADLQRLNISTGSLDKKTIDAMAKCFFDFAAGHSGIVGADGIIETNDIRMTGIVHQDDPWLSLLVIDTDHTDLRIYGTKGYAFRVLGSILIVGEPGLSCMSVFTDDQPVKT